MSSQMLADKRRVRAMPTFAEAAEHVLEQKRPGWRSPKHGQQWWSTVSRFALPDLGKLPVGDVTSADVLQTLQRIWHTQPDTARRVRQRISTVMEWAIAMQYRADNPCDRLAPVLGPQKAIVRHMRALPHGEVAAAVAAVRASSVRPVVKLVFEFLVLTAARSGEVRGARWDEIDVEDRVWTIPAPRMKAMREHRVPLCGRAVEILNAAETLGDGSGELVFPTTRGKVLTDMGLSRVFTDLKIASVPHGFRSSFQGLGGREDESPTRGRRGCAGTRGAGQGRGRLRPLGPVRAPARPDERLGGVPERERRPDDPPQR